jgi:hypothetical protein
VAPYDGRRFHLLQLLSKRGERGATIEDIARCVGSDLSDEAVCQCVSELRAAIRAGLGLKKGEKIIERIGPGCWTLSLKDTADKAARR